MGGSGTRARAREALAQDRWRSRVERNCHAMFGEELGAEVAAELLDAREPATDAGRDGTGESEMTKFLKTSALVLLIAISITALRGLAIAILWNWFGVPVGLPLITVAKAIGLSILLAALLGWPKADKAKTKEESWNRIGFMFLDPFVAVGIGWIVHLLLF